MFKKIHVGLFNHIPIKNILNRLSDGVIPVFMLHRIADEEVNGINVEKIDELLSMLKKFGYHFMGIEELHSLLKSRGSSSVKNRVMFTMDDGYSDQVLNGVPVFQKHECPVTIAIITDFISGLMWPWDAKIRYMFGITDVKECDFKLFNGESIALNIASPKSKLHSMRFVRDSLKYASTEFLHASLENLSIQLDILLPDSPPKHYQPISWDDVVKLEGNGVNFLPHTKNHFILSNLSDTDARNEIEGSISAINKVITPVPFFVYPNGEAKDYNESHVNILRENGIKLAFSTRSAYLSFHELDESSNDRFHIPRISLPESINVQLRILSKLDFIVDRIREKSLNKLFEMIYGLKRLALFNFFENYTHFYYLNRYKKIEVDRVKRLVFICVGNICRSPFAEAIAVAQEAVLPSISMGLKATGSDSPDPTARKVAMEFGYSLDHLCSSEVDKNLLKSSDLLIVMEVSHIKSLQEVIREVNCQVTLLGAWCDEPTLSIDDPYGRSDSRFRVIFSQISSSVNNLLEFMRRKK